MENALGDSSIGRGFAPGAATGDSGLGGRLELRRQLDAATLRSLGEAAELYAYGDYGAAWDRDAARDGAWRETLASAGIGLRLDLRPWLSLTPEIARQIEGTNSDTTDHECETRLYLAAVVRF